MIVEELYKIYLQHPSVQTDTRKLQPGNLFFALKGPNFNANLLASQALGNGAAYAIVDELHGEKDARMIVVHDVLQSMQELALHHRMRFDIPVIAVTGSNGKTTTKELVSAVLGSHMKCHTTIGNFNNHIGVPLTLLAMPPETEIAVIEMGANHIGEIKSYCSYTKPTHGLITNCGKAHLEGFGSEEGVRKGKGELFDHLAENNGTAFLYADYDYLLEMSKAIDRRIFYAAEKDADYRGAILDSQDTLEISVRGKVEIERIKTQLAGDYNLPNVLAAVSLGDHFGVPHEKIKSAIEEYIPSNSRSQIIRKGTNTVVLDAYNANPSSMRSALKNLAGMKGENKLAILGGMKEMGAASDYEHEALITYARTFPEIELVTAGTEFKNVPDDILHFASTELLKQWHDAQHFDDRLILIKGSRGMKLETLIN